MAAEDPGKRFDSVDKDRRKRRFEDADKKRASKRFARADALRAGSDTKTAEKEPEVKSPEKLSRVVDSVFRDVAKDTNTSISTLRNRSGQSVVDAVKARLGGMDPASEDYQRILSQISPNRREAVHAAIEKNLNKDFSDKKDTSKGDGADSSDSVDVLKDAMKGERKKAFDKMLADYKKVSGTEPGKETKEKIEKIWNEMYKKESDDAERLTLIEKYAKEGVDQRLLQLSAMSAGAQYAREKAILEGIQERMQLKEEVQQLRADFNSLRAQWQQQAPQPAMAPQQQWQRPIGPAGYESPYGMAQPGYRWVQEPIPGYVPPQPQQAPAPEAPRAEAPRAEKAPGVIHMPPDPTLETGEEASNAERVPANIHMEAIRAQGLSKFGLEESQYNKYKSILGRSYGWFKDYVVTSGSAFLSSALVTKTGLLTAVGLGTLSGPAVLAIALGAGVVGGMYGAHLRKEQRQERLQASAIRAVEKRAIENKWRIGADASDINGALDKALVSKRRKEMVLNIAVGLGMGYVNFATHHGGDWKLESVFGGQWWNKISESFNGVHPPIVSAETHVAACGAVGASDAPVLPPGIDTSIKTWNGPVASEGHVNASPEIPLAPQNVSTTQDVQDVVEPIADSVKTVEPKVVEAVDAPQDNSSAQPATSEVPATTFDFEQPVTRGGVWTASEKMWEAAGIKPGGSGRIDILTKLADLAEDYTQDGTSPGTRVTSYFRNFNGADLLAKMTGQENVTQVTIRNPINMAHLFGNTEIYNDMIRRITENGLVGEEENLAKEALNKLHTAAKAVLGTS